MGKNSIQHCGNLLSVMLWESLLGERLNGISFWIKDLLYKHVLSSFGGLSRRKPYASYESVFVSAIPGDKGIISGNSVSEVTRTSATKMISGKTKAETGGFLVKPHSSTLELILLTGRLPESLLF